MPERATWDVSPTDDGWEIKKRGNKQASGTAGTKSDAISEAKDIAKNNTPSQVVVRRSDGTIQESFTYD